MIINVGTGHRPDKLGGYNDEAESRLIRFAKNVLEDSNASLVISGMALGWDQALANAAYELGIPFHAFIPFDGQESAWPKEAQIKYKKLLKKSELQYICANPGYATWKMQHRNEVMVSLAKRAIEEGESGSVLALWNGSKGGTANCIKYANKQKVPVINVWNLWKIFLAELGIEEDIGSFSLSSLG